MGDAATLVVVSSNAGDHQSGESIKALQYVAHLWESGSDVVLITHARNRRNLSTRPFADRILYVPDTRLQVFLYKSRVLALLLSLVFHVMASRLIRERFPDPAAVLIHYLCPISPVALRRPPRGYRFVIGPLNGNIRYPAAFRSREPKGDRLKGATHGLSQRLLGTLVPEKRRAAAVLVSGFERTRASLRLAGVPEGLMTDVLDSGIAGRFLERPRGRQEGVNRRFLSVGRFVDFKGFDLAIRAVAAAREPVELEIAGTGVRRAAWEALAESLGVADRVRFLGWVSHETLIESVGGYRGFVFPSLAEANGIAVQEAMALGLPVIGLDWGGPAGLAAEDEAMLIAPESEAHVVQALADAMDRLATDPAAADAIAAAARARAERAFTWEAVAASWMACFPVPIARRGAGRAAVQ